MRQRLRLLKENNLRIGDIQAVIAKMKPLEGTKEFLDWLKTQFQVIILSDTFYQFSTPLMKQLDWPTLFCHQLEVNDEGEVVDYHLRQPNPKQKCVEAFHLLNYRVIAAGD